MAELTVIPSWVQSRDIFTGALPWTTTTWKCAVLDDTWVIDLSTFTDFTDVSSFEVSTTGYEQVTLSGLARSEVDSQTASLFSDDPVFSPSAEMATNGCVVYDDTTKAIAFYCDFGSTVTVPSGETLTINFPTVAEPAPVVQMVNPDNTTNTKKLYQALINQRGKATNRILSGTMYGSPTSASGGQSVLDAVSAYTGGDQLTILGFETADGAYSSGTVGSVGFITTNPSSAGLGAVRTQIQAKAALGHVPMLAWHPRSPDPTAENTYNQSTTCDWENLNVLGTVINTRWNIFYASQLDFIETLVDASDEPIPVLFRPLHENTGGGFWWSPFHPGLDPAIDASYPDRYVLCWQNMVDMARLRRGSKQWLSIHATSGTFTLTFSGQTTDPIAYDATAGTVQAALEALTNIASGDVTVTKSSTTFIFVFAGAYSSGTVPTLSVATGSLSGAPSTAPAAVVFYTRGIQHIIWVEHFHNHDPRGWNKGLASSDYGAGITGWEAFYPGDDYVDVISLSKYDDWNADLMRRIVCIYERIAKSKPMGAGELGPPGWPPTVGTWDMSTMQTYLETTYVAESIDFSAKSGTTGLDFLVFWMHWHGSWNMHQKTGETWKAVVDDTTTCHRDDFKALI